MIRAGQPSFSKGVLAPELLARVDVAAYSSGLRVGENIVVMKTGGFTIRPGWRYVSDALDPDELLFSFQFSDDQPYALAFGQSYLQPLTGGGVVLEEELAITGATNGWPVVLAIAYHALEAGDEVFISGIEGMTEINDRTWVVASVPDDSHVAIDADGTGWGVFTGATGGITRTGAPPPPPPPPVVPDPVEPVVPPPVAGGGTIGIAPGNPRDPGDAQGLVALP